MTSNGIASRRRSDSPPDCAIAARGCLISGDQTHRPPFNFFICPGDPLEIDALGTERASCNGRSYLGRCLCCHWLRLVSGAADPGRRQFPLRPMCGKWTFRNSASSARGLWAAFMPNGANTLPYWRAASSPIPDIFARTLCEQLNAEKQSRNPPRLRIC